MYHVATSKAEYFDQFDDYFKYQINICWMTLDDHEKKKKAERGRENKRLAACLNQAATTFLFLGVFLKIQISFGEKQTATRS